jgi:hypothetical protein
MNGVPLVDECSTIGPGRKLAPLSVPPAPAIIVGKVRRVRAGYKLALLVDRASAEKVTVSIYTTTAGRRKRVRTLRPEGTLTTARREVVLPLKGLKRRRVYEVVVGAVADDEKITATTRFRTAARPQA